MQNVGQAEAWLILGYFGVIFIGLAWLLWAWVWNSQTATVGARVLTLSGALIFALLAVAIAFGFLMRLGVFN